MRISDWSSDVCSADLDLDVHFGTGALTLDLEPGRGLIDAIDNPSRLDGLFIERAMVRASDKLSLLSAEAPIHQPVMTDGSAFFQLVEELRGAFEITLVVIPRQVLIPFPHLVSQMVTFLPFCRASFVYIVFHFVLFFFFPFFFKKGEDGIRDAH